MPIIIVLVIVALVFLYVDLKLKSLFNALFGTSNIIAGIKMIREQNEELDAEPKTPYGMDNLLLPQVAKDFPNMNIEEMKKLAEAKIVEFLQSQKENTYTDINIHKTVTNQYSKNSSTCKLVFQSAVGFREHAKNEDHLKEVRMNTEFMYVYDNTKLKNGEAISLNCTNCGAPIKGLGHKICPYCNTGLIDLATKTWKHNKTYFI